MRVNRQLTALPGLDAGTPMWGNCYMKKIILAATALVAVAAATPAAAQNAATSSVAADPRAKAGARLIKPLTLTANRALNFGTIVMGTISGNQVVSIDGDGKVTCGVEGGGLTCTDTAATTAASASYSVTGTQGQVVRISTAPTTLNNTSGGGGTLTLTPKAPEQLTLGNSGAAANDFTVGGSITISSSTIDGVYAGEVDVQVAYQ
jgi:hypothetical protein